MTSEHHPRIADGLLHLAVELVQPLVVLGMLGILGVETIKLRLDAAKGFLSLRLGILQLGDSPALLLEASDHFVTDVSQQSIEDLGIVLDGLGWVRR